jgi:type I restriction enzyme M protein
MRSLKLGGRCGVVVPNGTLFGDGVSARIKEQLLRNFNLHTIVRLPNGVFAPYTGIPSNLLFFDHTSPTTILWYYEVRARDGSRYSKSKPMQFEEFKDCIEWWDNRVENEFAWKVSAENVVERGYNLDIRNPIDISETEHLAPEILAKNILQKEEKIAEIISEINRLLETEQ